MQIKRGRNLSCGGIASISLRFVQVGARCMQSAYKRDVYTNKDKALFREDLARMVAKDIFIYTCDDPNPRVDPTLL